MKKLCRKDYIFNRYSFLAELLKFFKVACFVTWYLINGFQYQYVNKNLMNKNMFKVDNNDRC